MRTIYLTSIFLSLSQPGFAQKDSAGSLHSPFESYRETSIKLLVGGNVQQAYRADGKETTRNYFEIGIHKTVSDFGGMHGPFVLTHGISLEVAPQPKPIYGFKYSAWGSAWFGVLGVSAVYYTDFDYGNFKIRPEIGIGMGPFKLTAGFNIPTIENRAFEELRKSNGQVTLNILLKLKTLKKEYFSEAR